MSATLRPGVFRAVSIDALDAARGRRPRFGQRLSDVYGPRAQLLATVVQLEAPVTVRALARHAGVAPQTALTVINDLADAGIVSAEAAGRAQIVSLDREHLLAEPLIALSRTRARLIERLGSELAGWSGLAGAWLFGTRISFAGLVRDENRLVTAIREEGIALTPGSAKLLKVAA